MKVELTYREVEYLIHLMETTFNLAISAEVQTTTNTIWKKLTQQILLAEEPISCTDFVDKINNGDLK